MRKPVLDHGIVLNVHRAATGFGRVRPEPGMQLTSTAAWWYRDGSSAGSVGYGVEIHTKDTGTLTLGYRRNGQPTEQVFALVGRPCRFGGRRWMAVCPRTGRAVAKLYNCCGTFQPRHLLRAAYHSQGRVAPSERLRDREVAILRRLEADDASPPMPPRPKWMRWPTYWRLAHELLQVRAAYSLAMASEFRRVAGGDPMADEDPATMERFRRLAARFIDAD